MKGSMTGGMNIRGITRGMNEGFYDRGYEYEGITRGMNVGFYDRGMNIRVLQGV